MSMMLIRRISVCRITMGPRGDKVAPFDASAVHSKRVRSRAPPSSYPGRFRNSSSSSSSSSSSLMPFIVTRASSSSPSSSSSSSVEEESLDSSDDATTRQQLANATAAAKLATNAAASVDTSQLTSSFKLRRRGARTAQDEKEQREWARARWKMQRDERQKSVDEERVTHAREQWQAERDERVRQTREEQQRRLQEQQNYQKTLRPKGADLTPEQLAERDAKRSTKNKIKRGKDLEVTVTELAYGGKGVAKLDDGFPVFVERGLPGEVVRARITKKKKAYAEARKLNTISPPDDEVEAPCPAFGTCGGCKLQNLAYRKQLQYKGDQVRDLVQRIGGFGNASEIVQPAVAVADRYRYRNKMEFSASTRAWYAEPPPRREPLPEGAPPPPPEFHLGLHAPGQFDKILPLTECMLQHETADGILDHVVKRAPELGLLAYNAKSDDGYLRHLVLRRGNVSSAEPGAAEEDTFLAVLVTRDRGSGSDAPWEPDVAAAQDAALTTLMDELVERFPSLRSVYRASTATRNITVTSYDLHARDPAIYVRLLDLTFRISPDAFFQANTRGAEELYSLALDGAGLQSDDVALDLFCGTGSIGLCASRRCARVVGYELVESAVADATANAEANGVENATFVQGDLSRVEESLGGLLDNLAGASGREGRPPADVVFVNPNRPGLHPDLCTWLRKCGARKIVYVSCNPSTLARDLELLSCGDDDDEEEEEEGEGEVWWREDASYELEVVTPVDMFPQTPHVESVAVLQRRK